MLAAWDIGWRARLRAGRHCMTLWKLLTVAPDGDRQDWVFVSKEAFDLSRAYAEAKGLQTAAEPDGHAPHRYPDVAAYADGVSHVPPQWVRRGWAEVVDTLCGPTCMVDDDGPVLEGAREAVEAAIRDHRALRVEQYLRDLSAGRAGGGGFDWDAVEAHRTTGRADADIAGELADMDAVDYRAIYVGISVHGAVVALDEVTDAPRYLIERPDQP
jgi:hypothetical protein